MKVWCVYNDYELIAKFYSKVHAEDYCGENCGLRCEAVDIP